MDWFRLADKEFESAKPLYPWYAWHRGERFEAPDRVKGMAFAVIPFCWIVKFSGITRILYQFWKISPKYCCRKEKTTISCGQSGTPGGNRTHNGPLGGGCYIHLTTEAYWILLHEAEMIVGKNFMPKFIPTFFRPVKNSINQAVLPEKLAFWAISCG